MREPMLWTAVVLMLVGAVLLVAGVGAAVLWIAVIAVGIALVVVAGEVDGVPLDRVVVGRPAGDAHHLVLAVLEQALDEGRADVATGTGDRYPHGREFPPGANRMLTC